METPDCQDSVNNSEYDEKPIDFFVPKFIRPFLFSSPLVEVQGLAVSKTEKSDCLYPFVRDGIKKGRRLSKL